MATSAEAIDSESRNSEWVEKQATTVNRHMAFNTIVLMTVFTQRIDVYMGLKQFKGDMAKIALRLGSLSALGSVLELFANPFMGKVSDKIGRKPLMLSSPIANLAFKSLVFLYPSQLTLELDKVIGTIFSVIGGTTMVNASLADLFPGNPARQSAAMISMGLYAAVGIIIGPVIGMAGSKALRDPRGAFLTGAVLSTLHLAAIARMDEPLAVSQRKPFNLSGTNPLSFLKLFNEKRKFLTLALLGGVMQNIPEGKNIADIHQTFSSSDVGMSETARSAFVSFFGFCQVLGSIVGKKLSTAMGGQMFTSICTSSISLAMLWYSVVPVKLRQSWPMFIGAVLQMFVVASPSYTKSVASQYAKDAGWGMGEFQGALANMRALTASVVPLVVAAVYSWSKRNGRNWPGLAYQVIAAAGLLTELLFRTLTPQDLALKA